MENVGESGKMMVNEGQQTVNDIAEIALDEGYNVIKVHSYRDTGINYVIYDNFDEILQPQMVMTIGDY